MDITLQIMAKPATHDLSYDPAKEARRYIKGDVISVYKRSDCPEPPAPNTRMVFIHITDVPIIAIQKAKALMGEDFTLIPGPEVGSWDKDVNRRRKWNVADVDLPVPALNKLKNDREFTVTWTKAKPYLKNKVTELYATDGDLDG